MASRWAAVMGAADTAGSFWYVGMGEVKSWDMSIDVCCRCQLSCSARGLDRFQHTNRGYVKMHVRPGLEGEFFSRENIPSIRMLIFGEGRDVVACPDFETIYTRELRIKLIFLSRGRPCYRQPRQEWKDVQHARPSRLDAHG